MKRTLFALAVLLVPPAFADSTSESPTGNRTTPPTINVVSPRGIARGTTVELTVEGLNLANAKSIYFDRAGIKGKILRVKELPDLPDIRLGSNGTPSTIDLGPLPPRNQVTVEVDVSPEAEIGDVNFRLLTPLGTSPAGKFLVEPYYGESPDREPNNSLDDAFEAFLPTILVGEISRPGDIDNYKITVKAGEKLVFENGGMTLGSSLQPVVSIVRPDQSVVKEFGQDGGTSAAYFAHTFDQPGTYYIQVSDFMKGGRNGHLYRIKVGNYPLVTSAFPLGVQQGKTAEVAVGGPGLVTAKASVKGEPSAGELDVVRIRPNHSFSEVALAVGQDPEIVATDTPQKVTAPVTINGRLANAKRHEFRFSANKGQKLVFEVQARRLGSDLDSFIEVVDAKGNRIETATIRSVVETFITLRDHDSAGRGIRLLSWNTLDVGDYLLAGNEIMRIEALPRGPDDDTLMEAFGGQRIAYFGTSAEAHAIDLPTYKIQIHPPGKQFTSNGLPVVRLYAQNDDGGPGFGKDSMLEFVAPADGEYAVRIRDIRGMSGESFAYRLNIRPSRPDFRLSMAPRNPNVPVGGTVPVTIVATKKDGFNDPIEVVFEGLPVGLSATKGVIAPGQVSTTVLLTAAADAKLDEAAPLKLAGRANTLVRYANPEDHLKLVALMPAADLQMKSETKEVILEPGKTSDVLVSILRQNGFGGRVPVEVRNLPPRVRVLDVGLNGVLLNEDEKQRSFTLEALPSAEPIEQMIYVSGKVETRSQLDTSYAAPTPILLKVKPPVTAAKEAAKTQAQSSAR